jgi:hypothetical protein
MEYPDTLFAPRELTSFEKLFLQHYVAWRKSNGTVLAYELHAQVLQSETEENILALHSVWKLAATLTDLKPSQMDMCPQTCIAYTGIYADMDSCPYIHSGRNASGEPHYKPQKTPNAQKNP